MVGAKRVGTVSEGIKISCENLWKIFGSVPRKVLRGLGEGCRHGVDELSLERCIVAVRDVSFSVGEGEVFVVMGLSGSGKSTLLRCLNYLAEPSAGQVRVDGRPLDAMNRKELRRLRQERMGMVFQHFALLPYRTVLDNVAFGLEVCGVSKGRRYGKAREALELVGLSGWENRWPRELSGGMQQRVGLARALALNPEVLLMDEAFSALDPLIRKQMQDEFLKLVAIVRKTIVFITHDLDEALKLAHRIAVMKDGRVIQVGAPEDIVLHPADDYVAEFVSSVSRAKVVSARSLMVEPDMWISAQGEDPVAVLNRMRRDNMDCVFVTDSARKLVGVVSRERLARRSARNGGGLMPLAARSFPSARPDTPLEVLLSTAASTSTPIAVLDEGDHLLGVISHSRLLKGLSEVV